MGGVEEEREMENQSEIASARNGPFLAAALLCEKILQEPDGVPTFIRVIDRFMIQGSPVPGAPAAMPPSQVSFMLAVMLKSGAARGRHMVRIRTETPVGLRLQEISVPVLLEGDERGANVFVNYGMIAEQEGLYWIDIFLDEEAVAITRIPLRILYLPIQAGA
jgi:hypothetical protein